MGAKKGTIPQSTSNRVWFKLTALMFFKLLWENQDKGIKKTKRSMCIFMAQKNKSFRWAWLKAHPKKKYPKDLKERKHLGLELYHNIIADMRRFEDIDFLYDQMKKIDDFYYVHVKGKLRKKKYK